MTHISPVRCYLSKVMRYLKLTLILAEAPEAFSSNCLDLIKRLMVLKKEKHADYSYNVHTNSELLTVQKSGFLKGPDHSEVRLLVAESH